MWTTRSTDRKHGYNQLVTPPGIFFLYIASLINILLAFHITNIRSAILGSIGVSERGRRQRYRSVQMQKPTAHYTTQVGLSFPGKPSVDIPTCELNEETTVMCAPQPASVPGGGGRWQSVLEPPVLAIKDFPRNGGRVASDRNQSYSVRRA